jgi:hypothetical protein
MCRAITRLGREDFARVHYIVRIERLFDGAHHGDGFAVFGNQGINLTTADPVLAAAGAIHGSEATLQGVEDEDDDEDEDD